MIKNKSNKSGIKLLLLFVTSILIFLLSTTDLRAQTSIRKIESDHIEVTLKNLKKDSIRILQVTDLHVGSTGHWEDDLNTFNRIRRLVKMYDPELIFITGDLFTGEKPYGSLLAAYAVHFFDELQRPWFYVFGNHDPEGGFGRDDIYKVFSTSEWGILGSHGSKQNKKYDYLVDINIENGEIPNWQVYAFDTGPHEGVKAIQKDQLDWYRKTAKASKIKYNKNIRALSIFHIPLLEYQKLWDDKSIKKEGVSKEKVFYEKDDGTFYKTMLEVGNIKATFCGHDHYNNYWGKYKGGIILAYGYISGESTKEAWPTGGKLITIPLKEGEISIKNVVPEFGINEHKY